MVSCFLLLLHVVAEEHITVSQIEAAARNDRMGPTVFVAAVGLVEAAFFRPARGCRIEQHHGSRSAFSAEIEYTARACERALSQFLFFPPYHFAGLEVLAKPAFAIGMAVELVAHLHHAAVLVFH